MSRPGKTAEKGKINLGSLFKKYNLNNVKINLAFVQLDISLKPADRDAAWELYVEMLTRIVTQPLPSEDGDEKTALDSVYSLFPTTREILRRHGRSTVQFSKIAIPVLNQIVRPFTAKWHKECLSGAFEDANKQREFRSGLATLQKELCNYNRMLAEIAGVEDLTDLEQTTADKDR